MSFPAVPTLVLVSLLTQVAPEPAPPEPGAQGAQDPREMILARQRQKVRELEDRVRSLRQQAAEPTAPEDLLVAQQAVTRRARSELNQARTTREVAELAHREYLEGTFPQEVESHQGSIKLAEADLLRADEALKYAEKLLARGTISSSQHITTQLARQKAEFTLREAQTKLEVLQKYTRQKTTRELLAHIEAAMIEEADKAVALKTQETKEALLAQQTQEAAGRPAQDRVLELLDESRKLQARVVSSLREVGRLQEQAKAEPGEAPKLEGPIRELRDQVERLGEAAKSKLADAIGLAEAAEAKRAELLAAEAELKQARDRLTALEERFGPGSPDSPD